MMEPVVSLVWTTTTRGGDELKKIGGGAAVDFEDTIDLRGSQLEALEKRKKMCAFVFFKVKMSVKTTEDNSSYLCQEDLAQAFLDLCTSKKQTLCEDICLRVICAT